MKTLQLGDCHDHADGDFSSDIRADVSRRPPRIRFGYFLTARFGIPRYKKLWRSLQRSLTSATGSLAMRVVQSDSGERRKGL